MIRTEGGGPGSPWPRRRNQQGRYAEAEPQYQQSLAILEKALGSVHPSVAQSLENYAALLRKTGRTAEADKMTARAEVIRARHARENK